jgi:hypothetical protein
MATADERGTLHRAVRGHWYQSEPHYDTVLTQLDRTPFEEETWEGSFTVM